MPTERTGDVEPGTLPASTQLTLPSTAVANNVTAAAPTAPGFALEVDGEVFQTDIDSIAEPDLLDEIRRKCLTASKPAELRIDLLTAWPDRSRWLLLQLLSELRGRVRTRIDQHATLYSQPFDAVLASLVGDTDLHLFAQSRRLAVEAVSIFHPKEMSLACGRIVKRFRELGVKDIRDRAIQKEALALMNVIDRTFQRQLVREVLADAPVADTAVVPTSWELSLNGLVGAKSGRSIKISAPIVLTATLMDVSEGTESVEIAWRCDGVWRKKVVDRNIVASNQKIVDLATWGFPINSNNASDVVRYLADYEDTNRAVIPKSSQSRRLGWQDKLEAFLWGKNVITAQGRQAADEGNANTLMFRGADDGDEQIADGFHAQGTLEGWLATIDSISTYWRVRLAFYVSFVPVVLPIVGAANFVFDLCGETTNGKTTTQRICGSVWGNPDERSASSVVSTWDSTRVYRERTASTLNTLPLIIDDTKRATRSSDVAQAIYDVTSGHARGRGSIKGTQRSETYTTVLITSGEAPATSFTQDGGTRARVLCLWGSPFGQQDALTGSVVQQLNQGIREHYGHAGPLFVEFLLRHRDKWPEWRKEYERLQQYYSNRATDNAFGSRMAGHFAVIMLTASFVHQALNLSWVLEDPILGLWDELLNEAKAADRASSALEVVVAWAHSHEDEFFNPGTTKNSPNSGWAGRWDRTNMLCNNDDEWTSISFFPEKLRTILEEAGFEYEPILRTWTARNWIEKDSDNRARQKVRIAGGSVWVVSIPYSTMGVLYPPSQTCEPEEPEFTEEEWRLLIPKCNRLPKPKQQPS